MADHSASDHGHGHAHHWEFSVAPFSVALGTFLVLPVAFAMHMHYGNSLGAIISLGIGAPLLIYGLALWTTESMAQTNIHFGIALTALPLFIVSEVFIFLGLFSSYWALRLLSDNWPPAGTPEINKTIPLIMTVLLVSSSVTIHFAEEKLEHGDIGGFRAMLWLTMLLGAIFLGCTVYEYSHLIAHHFVPSTNIYSTAFYSITGFHASHVFVGLCVFLAVALPAMKGRTNSTFVQCASTYWHFVDIVWFFVVSQVYFW